MGWLVWLIIFLVGSVIIGVGLFFLSAKHKAVKYGLQAILVGLIIWLALMLRNGIDEPIKFQDDQILRYKAGVQELIQIRKAQLAYKNEKNYFAADYDSLIAFAKSGFLLDIQSEGTVPDSIFLKAKGLRDAERICLEMEKEGKMPGFRRDTVPVAIMDSLFRDYDIDKMGLIPYTDGKYFEMDTASVDGGTGDRIPVFEAKVHNNLLLNGLNRQLIINFTDDQQINEHYPGLKVGSLTESNSSEGSWSTIYELK